jgi:hypothetical protein
MDTDDPMQKAWENARELIRQENDLVNHRLTAWLSIQAFLFAAFMVGAVSFSADAAKGYRWITILFTLVITFVGFVSCRIIEPAIRAAYRHVHAVSIWWGKFAAEPEYRGQHPFPPIIGKVAKSRRPYLLWGKSHKDAKYDELNLDVDLTDKINNFDLIGIPMLIELFMRIWSIFIFINLIVMIVAVKDYVVPGRRATATLIRIDEDSGTREVDVSFKGEIEAIPELRRRIGALPGPGPTSPRSQPATPASGNTGPSAKGPGP